MLYAEICGADLSGYAADIGELYAKSGYTEKALAYFSQVPAQELSDKQKAAFRRVLIAPAAAEKSVSASGMNFSIFRNAGACFSIRKI